MALSMATLSIDWFTTSRQKYLKKYKIAIEFCIVIQL